MAMTLWGLLATIIIGCTDGSKPTCPVRCISCVDGVVECSMRSLVTPPKDFPPTTQKIIMDNNHLRVLGVRSFTKLNQVEVLRLKGNKVRVVKNAAFKNLPKLMILDLSNNQLVKIYGKGFEGMENLQTLSLQYNRISNIAHIFDNTPNLFQLNLAYNQLSSIGKSDFKTPTRIHYLDLRNNQITKISPEAFAHQSLLRFLFLTNNPLVTVPDMTFGSHVLQLVDFSNCQLTHVPKTMPQSVSDFRLGNNNIMQINDTDFTNMTKLRLLALNDNELHFVANNALSDLEDLDEIWLRNNKLVYIPRGLPNNLRKLYMDSNKIREIEEGLFTNDSRLDYMTVENNKIKRINNNTFTGMGFLKSLNFRGNDVKVIETGAFDSLKNLSTLSLSDNPLQKVKADAFLNLESLTFLHLDMCGERMTLEQNFLLQMPQLQKLSMMNSPGLAKAFVEMIAQSQKMPTMNLTEIDLTYNDLHTLSPKIQATFPALNSLALDGNSWVCDKRLAWLKEWMVNSDVSFSKYEKVICEQPQTLKGREIRDLDDGEFVEVAPVTESFSQEEYLKMMADKKEFDSPSDAADSAQENSVLKGNMSFSNITTPSSTKESPRKQLKQHKKQKKRVERKSKGNGKKRQGKKGKGQKKKNKNKRTALEIQEQRIS